MLNPFTSIFGTVRVMLTISWNLALFFFRWMTWRKMWKHSNLGFLAEPVFYICPPSDLSQGWEESFLVKYAIFFIISAVRADLGLWMFWILLLSQMLVICVARLFTVIFKVFVAICHLTWGVPAYLINSSLLLSQKQYFWKGRLY